MSMQKDKSILEAAHFESVLFTVDFLEEKGNWTFQNLLWSNRVIRVGNILVVLTAPVVTFFGEQDSISISDRFSILKREKEQLLGLGDIAIDSMFISNHVLQALVCPPSRHIYIVVLSSALVGVFFSRFSRH